MEKIWSAKHVRNELKLNIFNASVISVFLYGCETWIVSSKMTSEINSFATSCYRIMLGIKRIQKVPNAHIYEQIGAEPLIYTVQKRQLRWIGHALRRDASEPSRIFALYEPAKSHGQVKAGRPPPSYRLYIASLLTSNPKDLTDKQIVDMASNKTAWDMRVADIGKLSR